jgi:hypothetical protein
VKEFGVSKKAELNPCDTIGDPFSGAQVRQAGQPSAEFPGFLNLECL